MDVHAIFLEADERKRKWDAKCREASELHRQKVAAAQSFIQSEAHGLLMQIARTFNERRFEVVYEDNRSRQLAHEIPQEASIEVIRSPRQIIKVGKIGVIHDGEAPKAFYRYNDDTELYDEFWEDGLAIAAAKLLDMINGVGS